MAGSPSFPFYPRDYRGDPNVRRASFAARGVYMEILCLAHECEPRGSLATNGKPWTDGQIANAVGGDPKEVAAALTELLDLFVLSRDPDTKTVFSRRMVRDTERYQKARDAGQKGGNPAVRGLRVNPTLKGTLNPGVNGSGGSIPEDPQPPSSSSFSSSPSGVNPSPEGGEFDDDEPFLDEPAPQDPEPAPTPEPRRARRAKAEPKAGAVAAYCEAWKGEYGDEPHPTGPECVSLNAALKSRGLSQEEGSALMRLYLADKDPWLVEKCHPLPFAVKRLDTLRAKKRLLDNPQASPPPPPRRPMPEPIPPRGTGPIPKPLKYIPLPPDVEA